VHRYISAKIGFYGYPISRQETKLSLGMPTVLPHSTFEGHVTSSVTWSLHAPICHFRLVVLWNQTSI